MNRSMFMWYIDIPVSLTLGAAERAAPHALAQPTPTTCYIISYDRNMMYDIDCINTSRICCSKYSYRDVVYMHWVHSCLYIHIYDYTTLTAHYMLLYIFNPQIFISDINMHIILYIFHVIILWGMRCTREWYYTCAWWWGSQWAYIWRGIGMVTSYTSYSIKQ